MILIILTIYFLLFSFFAYKNFRLGVGLFIIALPTYLIRFSIGPLPTTILELSFGALFLIWLIKYAKNDWPVIKKTVANYKLLFIFIGLFFFASVISIFVSDMVIKSLGQWRAYFLEPMILFVILLGRSSDRSPHPPLGKEGVDGGSIKSKDLIWFLIFSTLSISILSIIQKFTGLLYPPSLWDDILNGRVVAFFTSPNAVGLYLAPIMMLTMIVIASEAKQSRRIKEISEERDRHASTASRLAMTVLAVVLSLIAILFTKSDGAWIALVAGALVFVFLIGYKKIVILFVLLGVIFSMIIPNIRQAVLFRDQAGKNRLTLWSYSINFLTSSPKNFVLGTGVGQFFRKVQKPYYNVKEMERLIYPHNIFLNFWTETGLLGMFSFAGIVGYLFYLANKIKLQDRILGVGLITCLVVMIVHGLVDVPYFKNDLSFLFWIICSIYILYLPRRA